MDGRGRWMDNVIVERLWRSVKYEEVYLHAYTSVPEARASLGRYLTFYNSGRPHSSLDQRTPDQAYFRRIAAECARVIRNEPAGSFSNYEHVPAAAIRLHESMIHQPSGADPRTG
jgi:putative transposase